MDLYIQMGHGMQSMSEDLISQWGEGSLILSPVNSTEDRTETFANKARKLGAKLLFDPQLYYPRKVHQKLVSYSYWPNGDPVGFENGLCASTVEALIKLNQKLATDSVILPSCWTTQIDNHWVSFQAKVVAEAKKLVPTSSLYHTIAVQSEVLMDETQVEEIISRASNWDVDGCYLVCEHPSGGYFVENPIWLANLLMLVSGLKREQKKVVVGYANHQGLALACSKCDAIASGNFLNVRSFEPSRFEDPGEPTPSRRAKWYYCPQSLSEFKIPFLDVAKRMGVLESMKAEGPMRNKYSESLFSADLPTTGGYTERDSHCHYLWCLREQCRLISRDSFQETLDANRLFLETANQFLDGLHDLGIRGQARDFSDFFDTNLAALSILKKEHGFMLENEWDTL